MSLRVDQIEEAVSLRVASVDATPYDQRTSGSTYGTPALTESEVALTVDAEGAVSHLRYVVMAESAQVVSDRQRPGEAAKTVSRVSVLVLYHLRPTMQRTDQRLAARAASAIVRAVKALPQSEWAASVVDAWQPVISGSGEWLLTTITFDVLYEQPV